ncbi:MAG: hypothetical protein SF162_07690 [bacterium]|nr:hypothetical protein [bacterium]
MNASLTVPHLPHSARWIAFAYGALVFIWLSLEDNAVFSVALIGLGGAGLVGVRGFLRQFGGKTLPAAAFGIGLAVTGAGIGVGGAVGAAALMLLKTGLHSHLFPDYPAGVMIAMLMRAPAWGSAGALCGISAACWLLGGLPKAPPS